MRWGINITFITPTFRDIDDRIQYNTSRPPIATRIQVPGDEAINGHAARYWSATPENRAEVPLWDKRAVISTVVRRTETERRTPDTRNLMCGCIHRAMRMSSKDGLIAGKLIESNQIQINRGGMSIARSIVEIAHKFKFRAATRLIACTDESDGKGFPGCLRYRERVLPAGKKDRGNERNSRSTIGPKSCHLRKQYETLRDAGSPWRRHRKTKRASQTQAGTHYSQGREVKGCMIAGCHRLSETRQEKGPLRRRLGTISEAGKRRRRPTLIQKPDGYWECGGLSRGTNSSVRDSASLSRYHIIGFLEVNPFDAADETLHLICQLPWIEKDVPNKASARTSVSKDEPTAGESMSQTWQENLISAMPVSWRCAFAKGKFLWMVRLPTKMRANGSHLPVVHGIISMHVKNVTETTTGTVIRTETEGRIEKIKSGSDRGTFTDLELDKLPELRKQSGRGNVEHLGYRNRS
ncbi:hypothetical protein B0H11DRAFT_1926488 [Mycena galericulata]|nr:hypothetical protein B0H11DRAFT_1926488 [Mycena galericulata]